MMGKSESGDRPYKVGLLIGGPSTERAISLNSARSVLDHLEGDGIVVDPIIYFDTERRAWRLAGPARAKVYSNTPQDFDWSLPAGDSPARTPLLTNSRVPLEDQLATALREADIVLPVMHGVFGEDGGIQEILAERNIPFVGSPHDACELAFDKFNVQKKLVELAEHDPDIRPIPTVLFDQVDPYAHSSDAQEAHLRAIAEAPMAVVKPRSGGSSIGVAVVGGENRVALLTSLSRAFASDPACEVVAQPYLTGTEFTVIVISGGRQRRPVALPPIEIELRKRQSNDFLSYRHKYLVGDDARYHCPPRPNIDTETVKKLQSVAEKVFSELGLEDFGRIDLWVRPNGQIEVSDVNPISGLEQNSFFFIAAAEAGLTHKEVLRYIIDTAASRQNTKRPPTVRPEQDHQGAPLPILLGGKTSERQVSLLTGTNVAMKLRRSERYQPEPYLFRDDEEDLANCTVWKLNESVHLRHSTEAILEACRGWERTEPRRIALANIIWERLDLHDSSQIERSRGDWQSPYKTTLGELAAQTTESAEARNEVAFIFNALHGGRGEDGSIQEFLNKNNIAFNGSDKKTSTTCMDKSETAILVQYSPVSEQIRRIPGVVLGPDTSVEKAWQKVRGLAQAEILERPRLQFDQTFILKPVDDGCSSGVVRIINRREFETYWRENSATGESRFLDGSDFKHIAHGERVPMPPRQCQVLAERYIPTARVEVVGQVLKWKGREEATGDVAEERDWIELTIGLLEKEKGDLEALTPSWAVADGGSGVLTVSEKFQGGTGTNLTPPPTGEVILNHDGMSAEARSRVQETVKSFGEFVGVEGYARVDVFAHCRTGEALLIEVNTLPGLSASTVIFHQYLYDYPDSTPREFIERIIECGMKRKRKRIERELAAESD